ncbi:hypothetical protein QTO34_018259 [Cnephaeus nilssonii]|uniref:Uncharacterized protein n=1 Tax=Cnephaeus nilssonii TaxID=3371016 RepID=A0AA40LQ83_CNENI|nr:hypothetical protein QTO34_018259 [Eptesicus nilssonii]
MLQSPQIKPRNSTVGTLFFIGGMDLTKEATSIEKYDLRTNMWSPVVNMSGRRPWSSVAVLDDKLAVCGWRRRSTEDLEYCRMLQPQNNIGNVGRTHECSQRAQWLTLLGYSGKMGPSDLRPDSGILLPLCQPSGADGTQAPPPPRSDTPPNRSQRCRDPMAQNVAHSPAQPSPEPGEILSTGVDGVLPGDLGGHQVSQAVQVRLEPGDPTIDNRLPLGSQKGIWEAAQ